MYYARALQQLESDTLCRDSIIQVPGESLSQNANRFFQIDVVKGITMNNLRLTSTVKSKLTEVYIHKDFSNNLRKLS